LGPFCCGVFSLLLLLLFSSLFYSQLFV
jgi:hypothetical protein